MTTERLTPATGPASTSPADLPERITSDMCIREGMVTLALAMLILLCASLAGAPIKDVWSVTLLVVMFWIFVTMGQQIANFVRQLVLTTRFMHLTARMLALMCLIDAGVNAAGGIRPALIVATGAIVACLVSLYGKQGERGQILLTLAVQWTATYVLFLLSARL